MLKTEGPRVQLVRLWRKSRELKVLVLRGLAARQTAAAVPVEAEPAEMHEPAVAIEVKARNAEKAVGVVQKGSSEGDILPPQIHRNLLLLGKHALAVGEPEVPSEPDRTPAHLFAADALLLPFEETDELQVFNPEVRGLNVL